MSDGSERLTADEFIAACDLADTDTEPFEIAPGKVVQVGGVDADMYVAQVVRRFPSVRITFVMSAKAELERTKKAANGVKADIVPKALEYLDTQIDSAPEAKAAFMACGCRFPGNLAVEKAIMGLPGERKDALMAIVSRKTFKGAPQDFFGRVGEAIAGMEAQAMTIPGTTTGSTGT